MYVFNKFLMGTLLATGLAGFACADTIITTNATPVGTTLTDFNWSLVFPSTATPVGTHLVSATLEVDTLISDPTLTLTNTAGSSQTFQFTATSTDMILTNADGSTLVGTSSSPSTILSTGTVTFTTGQTHSYAPLSVSETDGPTAITNAAAYLAGDTLTGSTLSGTSFVGGGGNIGVSQVQNGMVTGKIVFDFAPNATAPEPATMALMGSALIGVALLRKRIKT